MDLPKALLIEVVERHGRNFFLAPVRLAPGGQPDGSGELHAKLLADSFESYGRFGRLEDTPYVLYRQGNPVETGMLTYLGGQSDGYYVSSGFGPAGRRSPHWLHATDFMPGDALVFLRLPKS